jgi:hypothetical protein
MHSTHVAVADGTNAVERADVKGRALDRHGALSYLHALQVLRLLAPHVLGRVLDVLLGVDAQQVAALREPTDQALTPE